MCYTGHFKGVYTEHFKVKLLTRDISKVFTQDITHYETYRVKSVVILYSSSMTSEGHLFAQFYGLTSGVSNTIRNASSSRNTIGNGLGNPLTDAVAYTIADTVAGMYSNTIRLRFSLRLLLVGFDIEITKEDEEHNGVSN